MIQTNTTAGALLALEMEINLIEEDLEVMNMDLEYLKNIKVQLDYNRVFLKKEKVVTSLYEFKKNIYESSIVNTKIRKIRNDIDNLNKKMDLKLKAMDYYNKQYEIEMAYLSRKILPFERKQND